MNRRQCRTRKLFLYMKMSAFWDVASYNLGTYVSDMFTASIVRVMHAFSHIFNCSVISLPVYLDVTGSLLCYGPLLFVSKANDLLFSNEL